MISGNWAIGSARIATRPASTGTIAITIATIGRRMKNRDTRLLSFGRRREGLGVHHRAVGNRWTFDNDAAARIESAFDDPTRAHALSDFDAAGGHLVVRADHAKLIGILQFVHRTLRHEQ